MESNSGGGRILCSESSYLLLKSQAPDLPVRKRGKIPVKGKGDMTVYWVGDELIHKNEKKRRATMKTNSKAFADVVTFASDNSMPGLEQSMEHSTAAISMDETEKAVDEGANSHKSNKGSMTRIEDSLKALVSDAAEIAMETSWTALGKKVGMMDKSMPMAEQGKTLASYHKSTAMQSPGDIEHGLHTQTFEEDDKNGSPAQSQTTNETLAETNILYDDSDDFEDEPRSAHIGDIDKVLSPPSTIAFDV